MSVCKVNSLDRISLLDESQGVLFILLQRPYGIGDRISVSNSESLADGGGAQGWIVEDFNMFSTSLILAATNERASISNGNLAKSRIINGGRSTKATITFTLKFGINVPFQKIEIVRQAVARFVKERPREWRSLIGFRATGIQEDQGFIQYIVILTHREMWQNIGTLLPSKATLQAFCLELQKRLNIRYVSPPRPVDLRFSTGSWNSRKNINQRSLEQQSADLSTAAPNVASPAFVSSPGVVDDNELV